MNNNDILRRLRHALDLKNSEVVQAIRDTGGEANTSQVMEWLKRDDEPGFVPFSDLTLCRFLDGLIIKKRGMREDGNIPQPLEVLSNNEILRKLRIALEMRDDDMNAIFKSADFVVTKGELSAFFRKEGHRNYRECPEQVLRKFIMGLGKKAAGQ